MGFINIGIMILYIASGVSLSFIGGIDEWK